MPHLNVGVNNGKKPFIFIKGFIFLYQAPFINNQLQEYFSFNATIEIEKNTLVKIVLPPGRSCVDLITKKYL